LLVRKKLVMVKLTSVVARDRELERCASMSLLSISTVCPLNHQRAMIICMRNVGGLRITQFSHQFNNNYQLKANLRRKKLKMSRNEHENFLFTKFRQEFFNFQYFSFKMQ
jgi:hypothetical protein